MDGDLDFETTPLVNLLNELLTEYEANVRSLLSQLDTSGNRHTDANSSHRRLETSKRLASLDLNLQRLYTEITHHQRRQQEIRATQVLSIESGKAKLQFVNSMLDAKQQLEETLADVDKKVDRAHQAQKAQPPVAEIIEYARKLGMYTSAPPNFDPNNNRNGLPPEPPHPLLLVMRAGILNRYRTKKVTAEDDGNEDEIDEDMFVSHLDDDQFDDVDADDLLLSLDLNPDLD
ncbi:hypothetical protein IW140_004621 [Coemansia sp. RSA 1813]|nr:hypothetical protein EV178_002143 [Coemansia sp. RSA 1646]KAJ1767698.1 hypothetical protein LPJ74_005218 [Coemansia sp. RSA 1843]KAJ2090357.1 hypothetical protein IW138_002783 [Coemansia sp. RSA 986]KAJ2215543.1 hypothetical protein EV179_002136 [Coemansia sp. RSA 487]KAJ2567196.1 hypothetical protein IW140_004621 [Coemansia sp. RSA 1813]